jgi:hypothetical protein
MFLQSRSAQNFENRTFSDIFSEISFTNKKMQKNTKKRKIYFEKREIFGVFRENSVVVRGIEKVEKRPNSENSALFSKFFGRLSGFGLRIEVKNAKG